MALSRLEALCIYCPRWPVPNSSYLSLRLGTSAHGPILDPTGMHKVHLVPARTEGQRVHPAPGDRGRGTPLLEMPLTRAGLAMGVEAFSFAWDGSEESLECSLQQHLRGELVTSRPRPQTRSARGRAQSWGLSESRGFRERGPELEAAGARARWRPTPGAGSCAVTIGLRELAATMRLSSLCPGPPYRLGSQLRGVQTHSGGAARPPGLCEIGPQRGRSASRPAAMATVPRPRSPGCGPPCGAWRTVRARRVSAGVGADHGLFRGCTAQRNFVSCRFSVSRDA